MPDEEKPQPPRPPAEGRHDTTPHGSFLHLSDVGEHKWRWVKAAQAARLRLHDWVIHSLNLSAHSTLPPAATPNQKPNDPTNDPANGPTGNPK